MMKILAILTILASLYLATESREYKHHLTLKYNEFDVFWSVEFTYDITFYFKIVANTTGFAAFGWCLDLMTGCDVALGGVRNSNDAYLGDYYLTPPRKPTRDASVLQSLVLTNATEADGITTLEFHRPADTLDRGNDVPLKNGTTYRLLWATAPSDIGPGSNTGLQLSDVHYTKESYNMFAGEQFGKHTSTVVPTSTVSPGTVVPGSYSTSKPSGTVVAATTPSVASLSTIISSITGVVLMLH